MSNPRTSTSVQGGYESGATHFTQKLQHQDWLVVEPTPLKNDGVKVSWDDDIPNWMQSHKIPWFQTTHQCLLVYKPL